jgi:hypothetical protein
MPLASRRPSVSVHGGVVAALSILLGAWTHTVWDSFTHPDGWAVTHLAILHATVIHVGTTSLAVFNFLQQVSTFGAGALLIVLLFPLAATPADDRDRRPFSPRPLALLTHRSPRRRRSRYRRPRSLSPGLTLRGVFGVSGFPLPHCRLLCCSVRPTADRLFLRFLYRRPTNRLTNAP